MKQQTNEWHEMRRHHLGSSDAMVIMKCCPFKYPDGRPKTWYSLWQEKMGEAENPSDRLALSPYCSCCANSKLVKNQSVEWRNSF